MILLSWNCQGIGGPCTVLGLGELLRALNPDVVFLMETKCNQKWIEMLKRNFDLFGLGVDSKGKSGGLALLWRKSVSVVIQSFSHHHIDASMQGRIEEQI